jgi:hypothetical protein
MEHCGAAGALLMAHAWQAGSTAEPPSEPSSTSRIFSFPAALAHSSWQVSRYPSALHLTRRLSPAHCDECKQGRPGQARARWVGGAGTSENNARMPAGPVAGRGDGRTRARIVLQAGRAAALQPWQPTSRPHSPWPGMHWHALCRRCHTLGQRTPCSCTRHPSASPLPSSLLRRFHPSLCSQSEQPR